MDKYFVIPHVHPNLADPASAKGHRMSGALRFLSSSIGKKLIMGLTGFFLISFLFFHLTINLFLFAGAGGLFTPFADFLGTFPLARPIEWVLFGGFVLHFLLGILVWLMNRRARPKGYANDHTAKTINFSSRFTIVTGVVVLAFLVWHLVQFFIRSRFFPDGATMYSLVAAAFAQPLVVILYELSFLFLGFHLKHGFQSAFQSWGLRTSRYRGFIDALGVIVWLLLPLGFASIPLVFIFGGAR
jgi:succinate dehydrogenase / fumarate reductase cytochrome b subunit